MGMSHCCILIKWEYTSILVILVQIQRYERLYSFLPSVLGDTRRETHKLKKPMLTILCWPHSQPAANLVMFKISIHLCRSRSEKLNHTPQRQKTQLLFFKILKFSGPSLLGMIPFNLQPHFLSGGLFWHMIIVESFLRTRKTEPSDYETRLRNPTSSKPYQTKL